MNMTGEGRTGALRSPTLESDWVDNYVPAVLKDVPRFMMSKNRAWIVEAFYPAELPGIERSPRFATRSRYKEWKANRKHPNGRPAGWRIERTNFDSWEDVRRRDRMTMDTAVEAIRVHYIRNPRREYRIRNVKTNEIVMGAILYADLRARVADQPQTDGMMNSVGKPTRPFSMGAHANKN